MEADPYGNGSDDGNPAGDDPDGGKPSGDDPDGGKPSVDEPDGGEPSGEASDEGKLDEDTGSDVNNSQEYQEMLDGLNENKEHHIIEGSDGHDHHWDKLVPDKNWTDIKSIIKQVLEVGVEGPYKGVKCKVSKIGGYNVQVTYTYKPDGSIIVSDAWVIY